MPYIAYNPAEQAVEATAFATTTSEQTVLTVTDARHLQKSQFSAFWDISLGNHTSMKLRYYFAKKYDNTNPNSTIWYQVPAKNVSTGEISDIPSLADSTSPVQSGNIRFVEDFGVSAAVAYKITVTGVGGSAGTINTLTVMMRDN
jgi:hypothetical protein